MSLHGWLILDKPLEISSAQAVAVVKRILKPKKIGHGGTLDPLASGILPLALGEATKTFEYVVAHEKDYEFTVKWGEATDTDDREGQVIHTSTNRPTEEQIRAILPEFTGIIMQRPPIFSAISQGGQRAYAMARAGKEVVLEARPVEVFALDIVDDDLQPSKARRGAGGSEALGACPHQATKFKITCGKGTYIRSIARDMGEKLGCFGYVAALRRTRVGRFDEKSAISLDALKNMDYTHQSNLPLIAMRDVLDDILGVTLNDNQTLRLRQGQQLEPIAGMPEMAEGTLLKCFASADDSLIGIAKMESGRIKSVKNFNL